MQISVGTAHRLYEGLTTIEKYGDVRLKGEVRLAIAINVNALFPKVSAYETARARTFADLEVPGKPITQIQAEKAEADSAARAATIDVELMTFAQADFDLEKNTQIAGAVLAMILPLIKDMGR